MLFTSHYLDAFEVPKWVLLASYSAIALGTYERRLADRAHHGRAAHPAQAPQRFLRGNRRRDRGAASPRTWGTPVSTTHAIAGAIAGVGSIQRMKAVRWGIATNIVWAWVLTIPAAACIAYVSYFALHLTIAK